MLDNYFELLDLNIEYKIDHSEVKAQYLAMQMQFHPDRATNETERKKFLEKSIKLNEAEKTLKDDYLRAEYMLKLQGVEFNDRVLKDSLSQVQLEKIMMEHELLDETEDIDSLKKMQTHKFDEQKHIVLELSESFKENNFVKALDLTLRLKYLTNLVGNIKLKIKNANSRNF